MRTVAILLLLGTLAVSAPSPAPAQSAPAAPPPAAVPPAAAASCDRPVLMVVQGRVTDRAKLAAYARRLRDTGIYVINEGYYVAAGRPIDLFEGEYPDDQSIIVARFPCLARARAFWYSELYQKEILPLREGAGRFSVAVYAELPPPAGPAAGAPAAVR